MVYFIIQSYCASIKSFHGLQDTLGSKVFSQRTLGMLFLVFYLGTKKGSPPTPTQDCPVTGLAFFSMSGKQSEPQIYPHPI